jgi:hypothetical protein
MSGHRPSRVAQDLTIQRAIRALPSLPQVFTARDLRRQLPDRSPDQCRRLLTVLVARGYCAPDASGVRTTHTTPPTTPSDRVLALFTATTRITVRHATPVTGSPKRAARLLERMADLRLLTRHRVAVDGPPHWRLEYTLGSATQRARIAAPIGCRDPHCACPLADSDYDIRNGALVRTICRRHELPATLDAIP